MQPVVWESMGRHRNLKDLGMKEARFFVAFKPHEPIGAEGATMRQSSMQD